MLSLDERFELLKADLVANPPAFITSRELPFAIFRYDPTLKEESEWLVRHKIQLLATQAENLTGQRVPVLSLADIFWRSIRESEDIQNLYELERQLSFDEAEKQVHCYLSDPDFRPLCDLLCEEARRLSGNLRALFLVHATVFAPAAYRVSALFEQLHNRLQSPAVLFYPGSWRHTLNFLNLRQDDQSLGSYRVKIYGRES